MMNKDSQPKQGMLNLHYIFTFLAILGLVIFFTINNINWAVKYFFPLPAWWDQALYLNTSLTNFKAWQGGGLLHLLNSVLYSSRHSAPLFPLTTFPFYLIWGLSKNSAYLTNSIYMFIMLLSTYLIGARLFLPKVGILAVFMLSTFTIFIEHSRIYMLDFPMAAMFTWSLFCLIKTESFQDRKWSILFGISMGLTFLTKTMAGVFYVGPILWVVFKTFKIKDRSKHKSINFLLSIATCTVVAGIYYLPNLKTILGYLFYYGFGKGSLDYYFLDGDPFSIVGLLSNITIYPFVTISNIVSYPFLLLPIILVIILIAGSIKRGIFSNIVSNDNGLLLVLVSSGYFILTLSPNKGIPKYLLALTPAIVILICTLVINIPWKRLKLIMLLIIFTGGIINYVALTYGIKGLPEIIGKRGIFFSQISLCNIDLSNLDHFYSIKLPKQKDYNWQIEEVLLNIKNNSEDSINTLNIGLVPSHAFYNFCTFQYRANILDLKPRITPANGQDYEMDLKTYDYVITKSGFQGPDFVNISNGQIMKYLDSPHSGFEKMSWEFVLPDQSKATVYKHKPQYEVLKSTPTAQHLSKAIFEGGIQFFGYDEFIRSREKKQSILSITYYWKCLSKVAEDYTAFVHFLDSQGNIVFVNDHPLTNKDYPSSRWQMDEIIAESFEVPVPNDLIKGECVIRVGLWLPHSRKVLKVLDPGKSIKDNTMGVLVGGFHFENNADFDWAGWSNPKIITNNIN